MLYLTNVYCFITLEFILSLFPTSPPSHINTSCDISEFTSMKFFYIVYIQKLESGTLNILKMKLSFSKQTYLSMLTFTLLYFYQLFTVRFVNTLKYGFQNSYLITYDAQEIRFSESATSWINIPELLFKNNYEPIYKFCSSGT